MNAAPSLEHLARSTREQIDSGLRLVTLARSTDDASKARDILAAALSVLAEVLPPRELPSAEGVPEVEGWKLDAADGLGLIAMRLRDVMAYAIAVAETLDPDEETARAIAAAEGTLQAWVASIRSCARSVN